jgi:hypothetical protein
LVLGRLLVKSRWATRRILRLALRAIGFADVRFGILPSQSGSPLRGVRDDDKLFIASQRRADAKLLTASRRPG